VRFKTGPLVSRESMVTVRRMEAVVLAKVRVEFVGSEAFLLEC
jgi:hypothetical protein